MTIEQLKALLENKRTKLTELKNETTTATSERLEAIANETRSLQTEMTELSNQLRGALANQFSNPTNDVAPTTNARTEEELTRIGRELVENRAVTLNGNLTLLHQTTQQETLNPAFNQISAITDLVKFTYLPGGETYRVPYVKGYATAGVTIEGTAYTEGEPLWGYSEITKTKLTVFTEVSEEFEKLGYADYARVLKDNLNIAIKKRLVQEIIKGAGGSGKFTGILASAAAQTNLEVSKDIEITAIDENTLDSIILSYGGDEDVAFGALVLNKQDLRDFKAVKSTQTKKSAYDIDLRNRTINGIPYVISSQVTPISTAAVGDYTMFYGVISNYEVGVYSDIDVARSEHVKFKEGMVQYRASLMAGGNVTVWNGFIRTKKGGTVTP